MGIQITNTDSTPAVVYDKVFLNNLRITQRSESDNNAMPYYNLTIEYTTYGVDQNNKRYFQPKTKIIQIDDYLAKALAKAQMHGDMDLLNALGAIEIALANIIEDQTDLGTATVVN